MNSNIKKLKVKIKSLAAEAKIIRLEEKKAQDNTLRNSLYLHRIKDVQDEARHSQIAYAFLRGLEYSQVESKTRKPIDWGKVSRLIEKFGATWTFDITWSEHSTNLTKQTNDYSSWKLRAERYIYAGGTKPS